MAKRGGRSWSVSQQALAIQRRWAGHHPTVRKGQLEWFGILQPSVFSPKYQVRLLYSRGTPPSVWVVAPELDSGHRERLPHVYSGDRLCLYSPGEWHAGMWLADTVIPWAAEWLYHYELWRATDRWSGGGAVYAPSDADNVIAL